MLKLRRPGLRKQYDTSDICILMRCLDPRFRGDEDANQVVSVNARYNSRALRATGPAAISCDSKRVHGVTFP